MVLADRAYYVISGAHGGYPPDSVEGPAPIEDAARLLTQRINELRAQGYHVAQYANTLLWNATVHGGSSTEPARYVALDPAL